MFFFLFLYYDYSNYDISFYSLILDLLLATDYVISSFLRNFSFWLIYAIVFGVLADSIYTSFLPIIATIKIKTIPQNTLVYPD